MRQSLENGQTDNQRADKKAYHRHSNSDNAVILSILVYTLFSRMFDLTQPPVVKHSIAVA